MTAAAMYYQFLRPQVVGEISKTGRRSRSDYAIGITVLIVETCILPFLVAYFWQGRIKASSLDQVIANTSYGPIVGLDIVVGIILTITAIWFCIHYLALTAQRCRDFGSRGWCAVGVLVPILGWLFALAVFFIPGDTDENQFGANPRKVKKASESQ